MVDLEHLIKGIDDPELAPAERILFARMAGTDTFRKVLKQIYDEVQAQTQSLVSVNIASEENRYKLVEIQNRVRGMQRVLDILSENCTTVIEEVKENEHG